MVERGVLRSGLVPIADDGRRWEIYINGELATDAIRSLMIDCVRDPMNPDATRMGYLEYGAETDLEGRVTRMNTYVWYEMGGTTMCPFTVIDGVLYIAVIQQKRFTERRLVSAPDGLSMGVCRGFIDPNQTVDQAALVELYSEVGIFTDRLPFPLGEMPGNANNAWMRYMDRPDGSQGGTYPYAIGVQSEALEKGPNDVYFFKPGVIRHREKSSSPGELIGDALFLPWYEVAQLRDQYTGWSLARLLSHLYRVGSMDAAFRMPPPPVVKR